ncbi:MAG: pyridoxal phosphate-dependent aminotransferase [Thaumarchaeota archaeon]|nr:pyridoxal phosphate-dependent aminotransferase [Nitrososphaerota archaeon]
MPHHWISEYANNTPRYGMVEMARYARSLGYKDLINLNVGEPDFDTPEHIREAAIGAIREGKTHYTPSEGLPDLRFAISEKLHKQNSLSYSPDQITVVCGSQEGMSVICKGLLSHADEVIMTNPFYPAFLQNVALEGAKPVFIPIREETNFQIDPEEFEKAISPRTKAFALISPNNPTGGVQNLETLRSIAEIVVKHDLLVLSDEIYSSIVYENNKHYSIGSIPGMLERTITQDGFSKAYAMTGWRIGYFASPAEISPKLQEIHRSSAICAPTVSQYAALAALKASQECVSQMTAEFSKRRELVVKMLKEIPEVQVTAPMGAFYAFPNFSKYSRSDETLAKELAKEAHVVVIPGSSFGSEGDGHLRISFASPTSKLEEGLRRIQNYLAKRNRS